MSKHYRNYMLAKMVKRCTSLVAL